MMFKIMLEKRGMYGYAPSNHHTHGANWQYPAARRSHREDRQIRQ
jgi:hypothetical protein